MSELFCRSKDNQIALGFTMYIIYGSCSQKVVLEKDDSVERIASCIHMTADELLNVLQNIVDNDSHSETSAAYKD
nr:MAG TPA: hypothetical protein [Caudoviricetes sp.]